MGREKKKRRLSAAATAEFARSFGTLLAAGLPAAEALRSIAESRGSFAVRQASDRVRAVLKEGYSLSEAVRRSGMFSRAAVAAFRAEPLEGARRLERYCEGQHELGVRLRAAFLQPGILLGVTLLVLLVLLGVVLPGYFELFEREELPGATAALARMSLFLALGDSGTRGHCHAVCASVSPAGARAAHPTSAALSAVCRPQAAHGGDRPLCAGTAALL